MARSRCAGSSYTILKLLQSKIKLPPAIPVTPQQGEAVVEYALVR
jgi:hypothetical protein